MKLAAVTLARTLGFLEVLDLNPRGHVSYPDIVGELVRRYKFQKFPKTLDEFNEQKGVEFLSGYWGDAVIDKFCIYNTGLMVETRTSTDVSRQIIEDALETGRSLGLTYEDGMIKRWGYVSNLTFYSDIAVLTILSKTLARISKKVSDEVSVITAEPLSFEATGLVIGHDTLVRRYAVAPFSIFRRTEAPFTENKYFSEAPLPTDTHIALLEEFERDVLGGASAS